MKYIVLFIVFFASAPFVVAVQSDDPVPADAVGGIDATIEDDVLNQEHQYATSTATSTEALLKDPGAAATTTATTTKEIDPESSEYQHDQDAEVIRGPGSRFQSLQAEPRPHGSDMPSADTDLEEAYFRSSDIGEDIDDQTRTPRLTERIKNAVVSILNIFRR